ncbi:hypothetical protein HQ325_06360 [Rhodococcus sp. BP-349]|uniref:hypothetical protein n=1 Tax=unclassified Rhodococcus (in: high G+C Gram-positive bacteria) TaxID=192944 RepID=UPI001C9AF30F|nr:MULTISPECIES: hypothetical protein [unclassified Rhodococcus (in: high G+C Gram-positive bacteria)]MBY6538288.1 hypothetical protein [Rhodococcus sp. BP-363]MBY6542625.1 hypothetical protein [Rhodococcus sp. BP-369]MBY6561855.1 hypothetical protein [Rhodococcus sp. BP-370]MBY6576147.1 hypothetical protein [Rhodococcus sp. BP-364]MBY6585448.1 hypothetical protein [Rhodococcus sp. BP-358]
MLGVVGALAVAAAPYVPVVGGADVGTPVRGAAVVSTSLWAAIALVLLTRATRPSTLSVLATLGAVALGSIVADVQLFVGAIDADRLELFRPVSAAALKAGPGAVVVTLGHALVVVAGVLATLALARSVEWDDLDEDPVARRSASAVVAAGVLGALALAASFLLPAYVSTDAVVLAPAPVAGPVASALGGGLSAVAVLVGVAYAFSSTSRSAAVGALTGVVAASATVVGVRLAAALGAGDRIDLGMGTVVGVGGIAVLGVVTLATARSDRAPSTTSVPRLARSAAFSDSTRRHVVAGAVTVLTGVALGVGAVLPLLDVSTGAVPTVVGDRAVAAYAVVTVVGGVLLLFSEFAAAVRPAVPLIVTGHLALAAAVLQALVLGVGIEGVSVGAGGWLLVAGTVLGLLTLVLVASAGASERDGVDTSDLAGASRPLGAALAVAAGIAAVGLLLPQYDVGGETGGWIGALPWGWDVWGRLALVAAVLVGAAVAARARASRAAALQVGSAVALAGVALSPILGCAGPGVTASSGAFVTAVGAAASALVTAGFFRTGE